ncbi:hypothetical protein B0H16DRAFT_102104 [Mycena metata]|uniref:Secreted protein n=1 Tax=Mycena metata TaxID=1033252 RepID=A0AAD7I9C3_9AGAR|nr:hypothetical protein B0H16DRAFT_102104 [Mycena metata]
MLLCLPQWAFLLALSHRMDNGALIVHEPTLLALSQKESPSWVVEVRWGRLGRAAFGLTRWWWKEVGNVVWRFTGRVGLFAAAGRYRGDGAPRRPHTYFQTIPIARFLNRNRPTWKRAHLREDGAVNHL